MNKIQAPRSRSSLFSLLILVFSFKFYIFSVIKVTETIWARIGYKLPKKTSILILVSEKQNNSLIRNFTIFQVSECHLMGRKLCIPFSKSLNLLYLFSHNIDQLKDFTDTTWILEDILHYHQLPQLVTVILSVFLEVCLSAFHSFLIFSRQFVTVSWQFFAHMSLFLAIPFQLVSVSWQSFLTFHCFLTFCDVTRSVEKCW